MNFNDAIIKQMYDEWDRSLSSSTKELTYRRDNESYTSNPNNQEPSDCYFDPVTEEYVYTGTATPDNTSFVIYGLVRDAEKAAKYDEKLLATDLKVTVRVDHFQAYLSSPNTNDKVEYEGNTYRVEKCKPDMIGCFYNIFLRGV